MSPLIYYIQIVFNPDKMVLLFALHAVAAGLRGRLRAGTIATVALL